MSVALRKFSSVSKFIPIERFKGGMKFRGQSLAKEGTSVVHSPNQMDVTAQKKRMTDLSKRMRLSSHFEAQA